MEKIIIGLFFILLVLFPFGQLTKIPLGFLNLPEVHLYLLDVILFFLVLSWVISRIFQRKEKYNLPLLAKPIFLFVLIGFISLFINFSLFSGRELAVGFLYLLRWVFYAGLYFVLDDLKNKFTWLKKNWADYLIIIGSAVGIFALVQYFLWPNLKALEVLQYDPHFYRAVGTFLDPGYTGIVLVLTLILLVGFFKNKFLTVILYLALALTYARASWLVFFVGMGLLSLYQKSWKIFLLVTGALILTWFFIPQPAGEGGKLTRAYTIQARLTNSRQAVEMIKQKPLLGIGFNTLRYYQKNDLANQAGAGVDNSWLFVLTTTGTLGFLSYLWLWGRALKLSQNNFLVLSSLVVLAIHAFFINSLFYPWIMIWFWLLMSLGIKKTNKIP